MQSHHLHIASFETLGEQLSAVHKYGTTRYADPRLLDLNRRGAAAGASEKVPSDGGFAVAPGFARALVERLYMTGDILGRCARMPMTRNSLKFPQVSETSRAPGSRLGGVEAFWQDEAVTAIATKPAFELSEMVAKKITCLIKVTDELALDSAALDTWVNYCFAQESTFKLEAAIINGTGAGMPQGIRYSPATVTVAKEVGQAAATVVNANVQKMLGALWAAGWTNAVWLYNQDLLPQLSGLTTVVGTAGSQSNSWQWSSVTGEPNRLCGIPAYPSEYCQAPGTAGDLILADFSRYAVGFREQRTDASIHVLFESDQSVFKFVLRVDGQTIDQAPVTPEHGSAATSPFVVLGAR